MEAAFHHQRQPQPRISFTKLCLGLLLALLGAGTIFHQLTVPSSNFHLVTEYVLGHCYAFWVGEYISVEQLCDPARRLRHTPLPAECYGHGYNALNISMSRFFAWLTSFYCWHVSPTPYTCFARIGFRETVRYACAGNEVLERIVLTGAQPFLYLFVLARYL